MIFLRSHVSRLCFSTLRDFSTSSSRPSTFHALFYDYVPNILEKRVPYRQDHFKHITNLVEKGHCQFGGAWGTDEDSSNDQVDGALIILKDMSKNEIEDFVKKDPYFINGLVPNYRIRPWNVVVGAAIK